MKIVNTTMFRAVVAVVVGALMVQYREQLVEWITMCIGAMFFISGVISVVFYYIARRKAEKLLNEIQTVDETGSRIVERPMFPIVGLGSAILGAILWAMPTTFIDYLTYIFAAIIILGAIGEYASLLSTASTLRDFKRQMAQIIPASEEADIPTCDFRYWILPTLLLLFGIYVIIDPMALASAPFLFIGIAMMFYGLSELIQGIKLHTVRKSISRQNEGDTPAQPE